MSQVSEEPVRCLRVGWEGGAGVVGGATGHGSPAHQAGVLLLLPQSTPSVGMCGTLQWRERERGDKERGTRGSEGVRG